MNHNFFKPSSFKEGQHAVVGDCEGFTMQERWDKETPVFAKAILANLSTSKEPTILDYGCGVGRLSKEVLSQAIESLVLIGVDASSKMIKEAMEWTSNQRFYAVLPHELDEKVKFDLCYCIYVLQHIPAIEIREALWRIYTHLKDDGVFVYCSSDYRMAVRYDDGGFFDDRFLGVNLQEEISRFFTYEKELFTNDILDQNPVVKKMVQGALSHPAKVYRKKPNVNFLSTCIEAEVKEEAKVVQSKSLNEARKLLLVNRLAPGDILVMTNAIRDLHLAYPNTFQTDVRTPCDQIFENNPYITKLSYDNNKYNALHSKFCSADVQDYSIEARTGWIEDILVIDCQYPLINSSGELGCHFGEGHRAYLEQILGIKIPQTSLRPNLYLSQSERDWVSPLTTLKGITGKYWILNAGSKGDYTLKQYPYFQEVVNLLKDKIQLVQIGSVSHNHKPLNGVIDLVGKTNVRELFRLIYKAEGVITCVSLPMHVAGAFQKPCVVVAGGREGSRWELYPNAQFLYVNGCLPCAPYDGCWKSKVEDCKNKVGDVPRCMTLIRPEDVAYAVERYYLGGLLNYEQYL